MTTLPKKILARQKEITNDFLKIVDQNLADVLSGNSENIYEIRDVAELMHIHPRHLSNTIKLVTGNSPCSFVEDKILDIAKQHLEDNKISIAEIAKMLTYDPSNFTKFFKRFAGMTPKQYREAHLEKSETVTI
ncbi:helix-turn-helix domain-containing protein [Epilithonimonas pallida]|uniref:AraC-type DNA-binding protein n=1 Tax=Epilithonimonas pallida TaxID=373671 RepID=A0ABY1R105_9FLAO|nr:AraC family transcriptional regulator [Epilithonimonas pallida]SMP91833.1 AraC-type DNA-binding protein [Epilithonimonas pallida]